MISCSNKALMNFHHNAPNSHVPAINLFEFLVYAFSITSYHNRYLVNLQSMPVKATLYPQKILSIYWPVLCPNL